MAKCPNCQEELTYLHHFPHMEMRHIVQLDRHGDMESLPDPSAEWYQTEDEFECPMCKVVLFKCWGDAEEFLKGGLTDARSEKVSN